MSAIAGLFRFDGRPVSRHDSTVSPVRLAVTVPTDPTSLCATRLPSSVCSCA